MEKSINRQQMQTILDQAPQGVDKKALIDKFVADGFIVEGVNDQPKPNLAQNLLGSLAKPAAVLGQTAGAGAIAGYKSLTEGGDFINNYQEATKKYEKSGKILGEAVFGEEVKPAQTGSQLAGNLLQTGATLASGGLGAGAKTLGGKVALSALEGAGLGGAFLGGEALARDASAGEVVQQVATGAVGGGAIGGALPVAMGIIPGLKTLAQSSKKLEAEIKTGISKGINGEDIASSILTRQLKLNPITGNNKFKEISGGMLPGDYLVQKGIFGTREEAVNELAKDWVKSYNLKKETLKQLPDQYTFNPANEAIKDLVEYETKTGVAGTSGRFTARINELANAAKTRGLTVNEIDDIKNIYENTVALGYGREINTAGIERATRIDNALRNFVEDVAAKQGFTNVKELNKNTQLSRFLAQAIEDKIAGQASNNFLSLTDTIIGTGVVVDPSALVLLAGKKIMGSEGVQAALAKKLSKTIPKELKAEMKTSTPAMLNSKNTKIEADFIVAPSGSKAGQFESANKKIVTSGQKTNQGTNQQQKEIITPLNSGIAQGGKSSNLDNFALIPPVPTQDENGKWEVTPESLAGSMIGSIGLKQLRKTKKADIVKMVDQEMIVPLERYMNNPTEANMLAARAVGQKLGLSDKFILDKENFMSFVNQVVMEKERVMNKVAPMLEANKSKKTK